MVHAGWHHLRSGHAVELHRTPIDIGSRQRQHRDHKKDQAAVVLMYFNIRDVLRTSVSFAIAQTQFLLGSSSRFNGHTCP